MKQILVIDDDQMVINLIKKTFENQVNIKFVYTTKYIEAMALILNQNFDLFIIDYYLDHKFKGTDLLQFIENKMNINNRTIMLSASEDEETMINAYNLGVSNFLIKPISNKVLVAILNKNIRMLFDNVKTDLNWKNLILNTSLQKLYRTNPTEKNFEISITPTEFRILYTLMARPNWCHLKDDLVMLTKESSQVMTYSTLEMHISNLRKKVYELRKGLKVKRGVGYFLEE